ALLELEQDGDVGGLEQAECEDRHHADHYVTRHDQPDDRDRNDDKTLAGTMSNWSGAGAAASAGGAPAGAGGAVLSAIRTHRNCSSCGYIHHRSTQPATSTMRVDAD